MNAFHAVYFFCMKFIPVMLCQLYGQLYSNTCKQTIFWHLSAWCTTETQSLASAFGCFPSYFSRTVTDIYVKFHINICRSWWDRLDLSPFRIGVYRIDRVRCVRNDLKWKTLYLRSALTFVRMVSQNDERAKFSCQVTPNESMKFFRCCSPVYGELQSGHSSSLKRCLYSLQSLQQSKISALDNLLSHISEEISSGILFLFICFFMNLFVHIHSYIINL